MSAPEPWPGEMPPQIGVLPAALVLIREIDIKLQEESWSSSVDIARSMLDGVRKMLEHLIDDQAAEVGSAIYGTASAVMDAIDARKAEDG